MNKIKKFVAGCIAVAMLAMPLGCTKTQFVNTTDKIGSALTTINTAYSVMEGFLEQAIEKELPDAVVIAGYLTVLANIRNMVANNLYKDDAVVEKVEAAAEVACQLVEQASGMVQ